MNLKNNYYETAFDNKQKGGYAQAIDIHKKNIESDASDIKAYFLLANIYNENNEFFLAIENYKKAIELNPNVSMIYKNLGIAYAKNEDYDLAIDNYMKAIQLQPDDFILYDYISVSYQKKENYTLAIKNYNKSIELNPDYVDAYVHLGDCYTEMCDYESAIKNYEKVIKINPNFNNLNYKEALVKQGHLNAEKKEFDLAINCYNKALKFNKNLLDVYNNLGVCYCNTKQYELAAASYEKALELNPDYVESYCNLGVAYSSLNKYKESEACYKKAIELKPQYADAYYNLAILYTKQNKINESLENYEKSVRLDNNPNKVFNLAMNYLLSGNYEKGLQLYEIRSKMEKYKLLNIPIFKQPKWDGKYLRGKTLYLYSEQGLGDSIQFVRYISQLKKMGGKILFKPQAGLEKLFRQSNIPAEIIDNDVKNEDIKFDTHCSIVSLPSLLNARINNVPLSEKYLYSDPETVAFYKEKYFNNNYFKIGIKWQGNIVGDASRAASLENFYKLANLENVKLYSLQKDFGIEQLKNKSDNIDIINLGDTFKDFADTAAAVENLDLIVTIDTSVAHLAGAMNKPTWILVPHCPEWRWLLDREDTPWYKSAKLFRQEEKNNWDEVMDRICKEIAGDKRF